MIASLHAVRALCFTAVLSTGVLGCQPPPPAAPGSAGARSASELHDEAMALWDQGKRHDALQKLRECWAAAPVPAVLWNIVGVQVELRQEEPGWTVSTHRDLALYIRLFGATVPPERLREAAALRADLEKELACVHLAPVPPGAAVRIDGHSEEAAEALWVEPGQHVVRVEAPERQAAEISVLVGVGPCRALPLDMPPSPDVGRLRRQAGLVFLGVGLASVAAGSVLGILVLDRKNQYDTCVRIGCSYATKSALYSDFHSLEPTPDFPFVLGGVLTVLGLYFSLSNAPLGEGPAARTLVLRAVPGPGSSALQLTGTF